jgi:ubiquinone biosynthesis protein
MLPYGSLRHLRRARHIGAVLFKHGLGQVASRLRLGRFFLVPRWGFIGRQGRLTTPQRLRMALQELGPTAIKLGQVVSARSDAIPDDYVLELRQLQDAAPAAPFEQIKPVIEQELKAPLDVLFSAFDPEPVASASLGQVHYATLKDGRRVVVKVLRPGVRELVDADMGILADIAAMLDSTAPSLRRYDLPGFIREFSATMHDELAYPVEAHNLEQMARLLGEDRDMRVPRPIWQFTTDRVLTLERLDGIRIDKVQEIEQAGHDRRLLAQTLARATLEQILVHGFFHADPHQGNLRVLPDGSIALLDWGMVGRLDEGMRKQLVGLLLAVFRRDVSAAVDQLSEMGVVGENADLRALQADLARLITRYYFLPRPLFPLGELLNRTVSLMFHHDVRLPAEFPLLAKVLLLTEGICRDLDANFDYNEAAAPVVERLKKEYLSPARLVPEMLSAARTFVRQVLTLPGRMSRVLAAAERGSLRVRMAEDDAGHRSMRALALTYRVCLAIMLAAMIIGAVILVLSPAAPVTLKWLIGLPVLAATGLALMVSMVGALRYR